MTQVAAISRLGATLRRCTPARLPALVLVVSLSLLFVACLGQAREALEAENGGVPTPAGAVAPIQPFAQDHTQPPVRMEIPALGIDMAVAEMGWQIVQVNGERTTRWVLPENGLGWHVNSAGVGAAGNTILSGRQIGPDAPLQALAVGDLEPGHEVWLTDRDGVTFVYRIVEISEPIPALGASPEDIEQATAYMAATEEPRLTLATGWPDFTTTHRIFAVGELQGVAR